MNIIIFILNKILKNNISSTYILSKYANKSFNLNILGFSLIAKINAYGYLESAINKDYDVSVSIPSKTIIYLINNDKIEIFKFIKFIGDKEFGRDILETFINLKLTEINFQNSILLMFIYNRFDNIRKSFKANIKFASNNITQSLSEHFSFEPKITVTPIEIDNYCQEVDQVKNRVDLLAKRIDLIKRLLT